ncbi:MAG: arginine--tRNA ligase [Candidatus Marinamargulisbacteria bacterium]
MTLQAFVKNALEKNVESHLSKVQDYELAIPKNNQGDFALNIAFKLAKDLKMPPQKIAEELKSQLIKCNDISCSVSGGYVNLTLNNDALYKFFTTFLNTAPNIKSSEKILIEYVSANPTGPLHIGHGRWAAIGDTLYRLLKSVGYSIEREFYINDAGNQIRLFKESVIAIQENSKAPENGYGGKFVETIAHSNTPIDNIIDDVINYQKRTLASMQCEFENWFKESTLHEEDIIQCIKDAFPSYVYEKDTALWFKTTLHGDDKDRVIKKENGDLTYFAADIVYHLNKVNRGYSTILNIWGADHHGYVPRVSAVIAALKKNVTFDVILGQLVHLFKNGEPVKMSKRTGELIELAEVIEEIGADATRYFLLEKKPDHQLDFDLSIAKEKNINNPVYYIQYAHARISNILNKTEDTFMVTKKLNEKDRELMIIGARYYDVLIDAATNREPYKICHYLYDLAKSFHSFYKQNHILENNEVHQGRLEIIKVTQKIIQHCCMILGISTPNKM